LISASGTVVASAPMTEEWPPATAGSQGAYWIEGTEVCLLAPSGAVTVVGSVPAGVDQVSVSPTGTAYAYATSVMSGDGAQATNAVWVQPLGGAATAVTQQTVAAPGAGFAPWVYGLGTWTDQGIVLIQEPQGGCGCGLPFDMQMQSADTTLLDPATGTASPLTADAGCPLSGVGPGAIAACFEAGSSGGDDALDLLASGTVTTSYSLSGQNLGGDAVFSPDGSMLAYATVPDSAGGCGTGPDWQSLTTLRILDLRSGSVVAAPESGLAPAAWTSSGTLYGTETDASAAVSVVSIDPTEGAATVIWTGAPGAVLLGVLAPAG